MSIAPALPPPTSLPPPTGAAPPGAPPGASPFHSALEEELARTAPAEGQQTEGRKKAGEADAETGRAPSHAHRHAGGEQGQPAAVAPALPGAAPTAAVEVPVAPVTAEPTAPAPDGAEPAVAPPSVPPPSAGADGAQSTLTGAPGGEEPLGPAPVTAEAPSSSPTLPAAEAPSASLPLPAAGTAPDSPAPESADGGTTVPKSMAPAPAPAPGSAPVRPSPEFTPPSTEGPIGEGSASPAPGEASLGIQVSGRATRATGLSPHDVTTDQGDVRTQADRSPQSSGAREAVAQVASASEPAEAPTATTHTAVASSNTPASAAGAASAAPSDPLVAPAQPAAAPAGNASAPGAPLLASGVGMQEMIESIHATIELAARQGVSQARIALQPAELGEIRIHLTQTGDGLLARVTAETPAAAEALAGARSELHQSLSTLGTSLLRLDINSFAQPEGRQGQGAGDASGQGSSRSAATTGPEGSIDQLQATEADAATPATGPALGELVDVLA